MASCLYFLLEGHVSHPTNQFSLIVPLRQSGVTGIQNSSLHPPVHTVRRKEQSRAHLGCLLGFHCLSHKLCIRPSSVSLCSYQVPSRVWSTSITPTDSSSWNRQPVHTPFDHTQPPACQFPGPELRAITPTGNLPTGWTRGFSGCSVELSGRHLDESGHDERFQSKSREIEKCTRVWWESYLWGCPFPLHIKAVLASGRWWCQRRWRT